MSKFMCPHNSDVQITDKCCINECPYHMSRVGEFFKVEVDEKDHTNCVYYDSDLMTNTSSSRTQISALSRDNRRLINPKSLKSLYEELLLKIKTLHKLTHSIPENDNPCTCCGYPDAGPKCVSATLCSSRNTWATSVVTMFNIKPSLMKKQLVWQLLFRNELLTETIIVENGINLCSKKHTSKLEVSHGKTNTDTGAVSNP